MHNPTPGSVTGWLTGQKNFRSTPSPLLAAMAGLHKRYVKQGLALGIA